MARARHRKIVVAENKEIVLVKIQWIGEGWDFSILQVSRKLVRPSFAVYGL